MSFDDRIKKIEIRLRNMSADTKAKDPPKVAETPKDETPQSLRDTTYQMIALSLIIQSLLWNELAWEMKITLQIAIISFLYSGWIKKIKDAAIAQIGKLIGIKDAEILRLQRLTDEYLSKNKVLNELVDKFNAMVFKTPMQTPILAELKIEEKKP